MTLDNLVITNYRETGGLHLHSITRLKKEDAYALAKQLSETSNSKNNRYREDYFDGYYHKRLRVEEWIYNDFVALGGKPQTYHPIYFVLQNNLRLLNFFGNDSSIQIPLKIIESKHISFTPRDSTHLIDMGKTQGTVWRKEMLEEFLTDSRLDMDAFLASVPESYGLPGGYIEVQLWNDKYFQNLI
jgi:hypothetical protein